jgi:tetratricopeptide (TPR) repeat protein
VEADSVLAVAEGMAPRWPLPIVRRGRVALHRAVLSDASDPGPLDSARARAERALELAPGDAEALFLRGAERFMRLVLLGTGTADGAAVDPDTLARWADEAERALRASLAADPERAETWQVLSQLLTTTGRFAEAQQAAETAYEADPFLADAERILLQLCSTAMERGDAADIDWYCAEAYRRFPQNPDIVSMQLWVPAVLAQVQGRAIDIDSLWRVVDTHLATLPDRERDAWRSSDQMVMAGLIAQAGLPDSARAVRRRAGAGFEASAEAGEGAYMLRYAEAYMLLRLGEPDSAIAGLRGLLEGRPAMREYLKHDRAWEELWDDPAFEELVGEN